ncbi:MAG: membrane protein insertase YidC [Myxococcota bacterium]|nr:membrane protein insertase YidC [Myxococcota bacterium]
MNGPQNELDQKNLLLAIVLSAGVLLVWQAISPPIPVESMPPSPNQVSPQGQPTAAAAPSAASLSAQPSSPAAVMAPRAVLAQLERADLNRLDLVNIDGQIGSWTLTETQYLQATDDGGTEPFAFVREADGQPKSSLFMPPHLNLSLSGQAARGVYALAYSKGQEASVVWTDPNTNVRVTRTYKLNGDRYNVAMTIKLENLGQSDVPYDLVATFPALQDDSQSEGSMFMPPIYVYEFLCQRGEEFERLTAADIKDNAEDKEPNAFEDDIQWGGMDNRYFMTALIAAPKTIEKCTATAEVDPSAPGFTRLNTRLDLVGGVIPPGKSIERKLTVYGGPKKLSALHAQEINLGESIDFGIFSVICVPMLWLMRQFFQFMPNWGIAIILLTVLVKILTLPLTVKQYRSMAGMKKIQPKMKVLQTKYADDKVRMQQELLKLYREHKVNPLSGCLPMLMMMPIYFALYRTIFSAVELYQADFFGWITDLSQQDPYYITPVLLGVLMLIQMRLNPSAGDQMQQKIMMYVMPVMFTGMMLFLPSGLVLYILVNTVLGIAQQSWIYSKTDMNPVPAKA